MVGFRAFVAHHAAGLHGTVSNRPDGSVRCLVEGEHGAVAMLVDRLRQGPAYSRVDAVEVIDEPFRGDLPPFTVTA